MAASHSRAAPADSDELPLIPATDSERSDAGLQSALPALAIQAEPVFAWADGADPAQQLLPEPHSPASPVQLGGSFRVSTAHGLLATWATWPPCECLRACALIVGRRCITLMGWAWAMK